MRAIEKNGRNLYENEGSIARKDGDCGGLFRDAVYAGARGFNRLGKKDRGKRFCLLFARRYEELSRMRNGGKKRIKTT